MIPPNVYFIATMYTADRSIKLLDVALRRRFAFVELLPDLSEDSPLFEQAIEGSGLTLDGFLRGLNEAIARQEGREKQIGHSFFIRDGEPIADAEGFARVFRQEVLPLLQEYCYDDYATLAGREAGGGTRVDRCRGAIIGPGRWERAVLVGAAPWSGIVSSRRMRLLQDVRNRQRSRA